jgi:hypothetical protein
MDNSYDAMLGIVNGKYNDPSLASAVSAGSSTPIPPSVPQLKAAAPNSKDNPGFLDNYGWRGVFGGLAGAVQGVTGAFSDISHGLDSAIDTGMHAALGITPKTLMPDANGKMTWVTADQKAAAADQALGQAKSWFQNNVIAKPVGTGANITKNVVEFSAAFVPVAKAIEGIEWASRFTKSAALVAAGSASVFAGSDPMSGNLANIASDVGIDKSAFAQELHVSDLVDALKVNETDTSITARLKNAVTDGAISQVALDGALRVLGKGAAVVREMTKARMAIDASAAAEATTIPTDAIKADIAMHADDAVAAMKGEPSTAEKAHVEAQDAIAEDTGSGAQPGDKITLPEEPTATPTGGAERLGPLLEDAMAQLSPEDLAKTAKDFEEGRYFEALERTGVNPTRIDFGKFLSSFADQEAAKAGLQDLMLRAAKAAEPISDYFGSKTAAGQDAAMFGQLTGQTPQDVVQGLADKTQNLHTYFHVAAGLVAGETQKLYALALKAKPYANLGSNSPEVLALMKQWQTLTTLQGAFRGSASNVGRGLRALQDVNRAVEAQSGVDLANSILGNAQKDAVTDRLNQITDSLGGNMSARQRSAFIQQILDTKGDVVKIAKAGAEGDSSVWTAGFRALRETSANLFGISTFTNVAASIAGYITSEVVANQLVHPIAMLTKNRDWVAASAAAKAQLGAFGPSLVSGLAHGLQLVSTDALHEVGNALDGTGVSGLRAATDAAAGKVNDALAQLPTGNEKLGKAAQGPLQDKYMREGITRDADWYLQPQAIKDWADQVDHGPAFFQAATRSLLGALGATSNTFGALSRFGRTITVDLADNIAGNTVYAATRWSEAVRTATKVGIDRGMYGDELGKFAQAEATRLVSQTSGDIKRALQNAVQAGSSDLESLKNLAQDYLDRNGIESIAQDTARRMLFQDDLKWGPSEGVRSLLGKWDPGGIIVPFVKTPLRIIETGVQDFSPLGVLFKSTREKLTSGGPESVTTAAKMLMGTMLLLEGYNGAAAGNIVGYDGGPRSTARLERPSYSQKVGDKWIDFSRFDPLSFTLGAGADLYQFEQAEKLRNENSVAPSPELIQLANAFFMTAVQGVLSKSWLTSLNNWAQLTSPDRADGAAQALWAGLEQRFVPMSGLQKAIAQEGTGHIKQTQTLLDRYKQSWAMFNDTLPDKRDSVLGEPVSYDRVAGFRVAGHEDDPVKRELGKLAFQLPPDVRTINGVGLTADQMEKMKELQGKADLGGTIRDRLSDLFSSPEYQDMTQAQKVDAVQQYRSMYQQYAKQQLLAQDPQLNANVQAQRMVRMWQQIGVAPDAIPSKVAAFKKELLAQ